MIEGLRSEAYEKRYADVQRVEIEFQGEAVFVPLEHVSKDLESFFLQVDSMFRACLGRAYTEALVN
jgi:hypothetical protein